MSGSESSKTEKPTPKKLKDARKEGNVVYSHDLSMFAAISVVVAILILGRAFILSCFTMNYDLAYKLIGSREFDLHILTATALQMLTNLTKCILLLTIAGAVAAMITTIVQLGGLIAKEELFEFKLEAFDIVKNAKEMFSKKNLAKFLFNNIKLIIMFLLAYWLVLNNLSQILTMVAVPLIQMIALSSLILAKIIIILLAVYFIFAFIDFFLEKKSWYKQLMMSHEEIKDEQKETEGNMEIKQRLRQLRQEMLAEDDSMFTQYKDSMLVLANPTHIAILILYLPERWGLPLVLLKVKGPLAKQMFRIARKLGIPIIREKWLARQLYELALINQFVPGSLIKEVAEVIAKNLNLLPKIAHDLEMMKKKPPMVPPTVAKPGTMYSQQL